MDRRRMVAIAAGAALVLGALSSAGVSADTPTGGGSDDVVPSESISLNFRQGWPAKWYGW